MEEWGEGFVGELSDVSSGLDDIAIPDLQITLGLMIHSIRNKDVKKNRDIRSGDSSPPRHIQHRIRYRQHRDQRYGVVGQCLQ